MKFRNTKSEAEKIEPQMAPMIDVVFQLLIFFMLTLKIIEPEGDFSINMPQGRPAPDPNQQVQLQPQVIEMRANADGTLNYINYGGLKYTPAPETDAGKVATYIKLNEKEDLTPEQAARRLGEDKEFAKINRKIADYVKEQSQGDIDKAKLDEEMKAKIQFDYNLQHRYLIKATSACRGSVKVVDQREVTVDLIKNIEFVRAARPGAK